MKKLIVSLMFVATVSLAQDTNTVIKQSFITFFQGTESNGSVFIALHPEYAPSIVVNGKTGSFGLGVALLTDADAIPSLAGTMVGSHVFGGLRFDYLAHQAFASTVGAGVHGSLQLWNHTFTGFVEGGANIPFAGFGVKNGEIGGMYGAGGYTVLWQPSAKFNLALEATAEKWTQFPGEVFLFGPVVHWSFK